MSNPTDELNAALARQRGEPVPPPEEDIGAAVAAAGVENVTTRQAEPQPKTPSDFRRPVVNQVSEVTGFRSMAAGYQSFIDDIDRRNAAIDAEVKRLHAEAVALLATKKENLVVRADKVSKLAGVRQVIRTLEDTDTQRQRIAEDANTADLRNAEDAELRP